MSLVTRLVLVASVSSLLAGCAGYGNMNWPGTTSTPPVVDGTVGEKPSAGQLSQRVKLALLLPLSGPNAAMGEAMLQAAQLAVSDLNETNIDLMALDTRGTSAGASAAMAEATQNSANLVLGPVTSTEVQAVKTSSNPRNLNVLTFSTDWRQAGGNVLSMGILPFDQAQRMARYAADSNKKSVLIVRGTDLYGEAVGSAFKKAALRHGVKIVADITPETFAAFKGSYDAVFLPIAGNALKSVLAALPKTGNAPLLMGTGLWDEAAIKALPVLNGAVFAAPSTASRSTFERSYRSTFGTTPPRLASLSYDSVALAIMVARLTSKTAGAPDLSKAQLTNPNGFAGVDGLFRLNADGTNERGLAVHRIEAGGSDMIQNAPQSFM